MPFARIITHSVIEARPVAEQLEKHGYQVQMVCGGEMLFDPADLEVNLKESTVEEGLRKVAKIIARRRAGLPANYIDINDILPNPELPARKVAQSTNAPELQIPPSIPVADAIDFPKPSQLDEAIHTAEARTTEEPLGVLKPQGAQQQQPEAPLLPRHRKEHGLTVRLVIARSEAFFWKAAGLVAAAAVVLLAVVALFQRFSPLPATLVRQSGEIEGKPFMKVAEPRPKIIEEHFVDTSVPVAAPEPSPADESTVTASDSSTRRSLESRAALRRRLPTSSESDFVAQDTVVRYANRSAPAMRPGAGSPAVRNYSDTK